MRKLVVMSIACLLTIHTMMTTMVYAQDCTTSGYIVSEEVVIGKSGKGRDIYATRIYRPDVEDVKEALLVFAIHGYEDQFERDGEYLVHMGDNLIHYFEEYLPYDYAITIVPLANPDGLVEGYTNNGPGRAQIALGVDINRDFDYNFVANVASPRNKTLAEPFSSSEAQALRDLVLSREWDFIIDFHGWWDLTIGNKELAQAFNLPYSGGYTESSGTFSAWASLHSRSLLVELPPELVAENNIYGHTQAVITALEKLMLSGEEPWAQSDNQDRWEEEVDTGADEREAIDL